MNIKFFFFILFSIFLSCNNFFYENKIEFDDNEWNKDEQLNCEFEIIQTEASYDIYINFACKEEYKTNNIWLFVEVISPSGNIQKDTIEYYITDNVGKWFGKKRSNFIENKFLYKQNIKFPEKGLYIFTLQHGMRKKDTPLAVSIGLTIRKR